MITEFIFWVVTSKFQWHIKNPFCTSLWVNCFLAAIIFGNGIIVALAGWMDGWMDEGWHSGGPTKWFTLQKSAKILPEERCKPKQKKMEKNNNFFLKDGKIK